MRNTLLALVQSACAALLVPTIALARPEELAAVAKLQLDTFDPAPPPGPSGPLGMLFGGGGQESAARRAARVARLADELADRVEKGSSIFVASGALGDDPTALLGAVDLSEQEMQSPFHAITEGLYLSSMVVAMSTRRNGIGRRLLSAAEHDASRRGAECVWLFVEASNTAAVNLYRSCEYIEQADTPRHAAFATALEVRQREPLLLRKSLP